MSRQSATIVIAVLAPLLMVTGVVLAARAAASRHRSDGRGVRDRAAAAGFFGGLIAVVVVGAVRVWLG